jgi:uncharacterized protein (UPF0335 family)
MSAGHNGVDQQELASYVNRIEALDGEIAELNADKSSIFKELKGSGYDPKIVRKVLAIRRKDASERAEEDAMVGLYLEALEAASRVHAREGGQ